ncbi:MAG: SDR family NAD(P)-dependent oxidoreductase [Burkholderiales bacterium]
MGTSLAGQHAVITGAGRGIGLAIARAFATEGATLSLIGRDAARLAAARDTLHGSAQHGVYSIDIANEDAVRAGFASIFARHPRIDILVNNAGQAESAPLAKTSLALFERMLSVNLTGTFLCTREALPGMLAAKSGRIVNVASTAGLVGYAYVSAYSASKHAVIGLTRSLALETAKFGVTVNALCPGYTETDIVQTTIANITAKTGKTDFEARTALTAPNPQGRMVQPSEVANAALWLCAAGSEAITGQAISISGGEVMSK